MVRRLIKNQNNGHLLQTSHTGDTKSTKMSAVLFIGLAREHLGHEANSTHSQVESIDVMLSEETDTTVGSNNTNTRPKETPLIWMIGGDIFSTSGNVNLTVYSLSGASKTGIFSSFLIRDCASDDLAAFLSSLLLGVVEGLEVGALVVEGSVVRNHQDSAGVGLQHEKIRFAEQSTSKCQSHTPTTREGLCGELLPLVRETKTSQNTGSTRFGPVRIHLSELGLNVTESDIKTLSLLVKLSSVC
ncbi:ABC transporter domain-containing protein, partial [Aureobasidium melanogenum]